MVRTTTAPKATKRFRVTAWLLGGAIVLALGSLLYWNLQQDYRRALDTEYARLGDSARIIEEDVNHIYRSIDFLLKDVVDEVGRRGANGSSSINEYLANRARAFPEIRTVLIANSDGIVTATTQSVVLGMDVSARPYYVVVKNSADRSRTFYTPLVQTKPLNVYVIFASRALPAPNGQWSGLVSVALEVRIFDSLLAGDLPSGENTTATLVGKDGRIISRVPNPERFVGFDLSRGSAYAQHMATGLKMSFQRHIALSDHIEKISAIRSIYNDDYKLAVSKSLEEALAPWWSQAINQCIAFVLLSVAVIALTWLAIRHHGREAQARFDAELARHEAENATNAKSAFLAMISHEIRTPITGVLGMADLLRRTPLNEEQTGYLDTLASSTKTLLTILNDILDISKIEAGKLVFEEIEFSPNITIRNTINLFKSIALSKEVAIVSEITEDLPPSVIGDLKTPLIFVLQDAV